MPSHTPFGTLLYTDIVVTALHRLSHRRTAAARLLKENLLEFGPLWLSLFFGFEWAVSTCLDSSCSRLGLALHAHALPRQAQLSNRWRMGACRRCAADTADVLQRCAPQTPPAPFRDRKRRTARISAGGGSETGD